MKESKKKNDRKKNRMGTILLGYNGLGHSIRRKRHVLAFTMLEMCTYHTTLTLSMKRSGCIYRQAAATQNVWYIRSVPLFGTVEWMVGWSIHTGTGTGSIQQR